VSRSLTVLGIAADEQLPDDGRTVLGVDDIWQTLERATRSVAAKTTVKLLQCQGLLLRRSVDLDTDDQDRKQILQQLKKHIEAMCKDADAQLVLFTAFDVVE
jgi:hypothetical protein